MIINYIAEIIICGIYFLYNIVLSLFLVIPIIVIAIIASIYYFGKFILNILVRIGGLFIKW